jgi:hypothetical protein
MTNASTPVPKCRRCRDTGVVRRNGWPRECSCKRAPKVPGPRAATHEGECGVCERRYTISKVGEQLALHGYARPGDGYIIGECPGRDKLPVERSVVTLEIALRYAQETIASHEFDIMRLRSGQVTEVTYRKRNWQVRNGDAPDAYKVFTIKKGDARDIFNGIPSFDERVDTLVHQHENIVKHARMAEKRALDRIATWQPTEPTPIKR